MELLQLSYKLTDDVSVSLSLSYNLTEFRSRVLFIAEEKTLEYDNSTLYDAEGNVLVPHRSITDLETQYREFVAAVMEDRDPSIGGESILATMRLLPEVDNMLSK